MKKSTLKRLGLEEGASMENIEAAVLLALDAKDSAETKVGELEAAAKKMPAETSADKMEKRIRSKIAESGGALNREQAALAIEHQDAAEAAKKAKAKK